jgi:diguanylate cyclase (GGDEF)-like protein
VSGATELILEDAGYRPFHRAGLWRRIGAMAVVAAAAEASLALPPGPVSAADTAISASLLVATAVAVVLLPWDRLPSWATVLVPLSYLGSVLTLILAAGGSNAGVGTVVLIPLAWAALYHRRWESIVVVAGIVAVEVVTALVPVQLATAVILRRVAVWTVLGLVISLSAQALRHRLAVAFAEGAKLHAEQSETLHRNEALRLAGEELSAKLDPDDVIAAAARLVAQLVCPGADGLRRAQYVRHVDGIARFDAQYDETGATIPVSFQLSQHPGLEAVFRTGEGSFGPIDIEHAGPRVSAVATALGIRYSAYVPIRVEGELDGVLAISMRDVGMTPDLFEQCKALGHLTELALGNALAHRQLLELARTDSLTGLANRRAFEEILSRRPGRGPFALLALDLDGLKEVNDSQGHDAGDQLLKAVAGAMRRSLRRGDVLSRLGGDEFAVLSFEADIDAAKLVATRMLEALAATTVAGITPRASIGIAAGTEEDDTTAVFRAADAAMYQAKRLGGDRFVASDGVIAASHTERRLRGGDMAQDQGAFEGDERRGGADRRSGADRREGSDRRAGAGGYGGDERRSGSDRRAGGERRSGADRRKSG